MRLDDRHMGKLRGRNLAAGIGETIPRRNCRTGERAGATVRHGVILRRRDLSGDLLRENQQEVAPFSISTGLGTDPPPKPEAGKDSERQMCLGVLSGIQVLASGSTCLR